MIKSLLLFFMAPSCLASILIGPVPIPTSGSPVNQNGSIKFDLRVLPKLEIGSFEKWKISCSTIASGKNSDTYVLAKAEYPANENLIFTNWKIDGSVYKFQGAIMLDFNLRLDPHGLVVEYIQGMMPNNDLSVENVDPTGQTTLSIKNCIATPRHEEDNND